MHIEWSDTARESLEDALDTLLEKIELRYNTSCFIFVLDGYSFKHANGIILTPSGRV